MAQTKSLYLTKVQLKAELDRCLNCANKPCMNACPVNCSPQEFISHAKNGDFEQAVATITRNNPMGQTCGLICPDKFCMKACTRSRIDFAVNIPKVQATILENYRNPSAEAKAIRPNGRKVAVIGAGPAGLAAAAELGKQGYYVCLYEASDKIGGALNMIPDERLPYEVIAKDWSFIFNRDFITLYLTTKIGSPSDLFSQGFDGVIVATGEPNVTDLGIPGQEYAVSYMEYLHHPSKYETKGRVAVIADGSPIVLTLPFVFAEDLQDSYDYFAGDKRAAAARIFRLFGAALTVLLPAAYVALQSAHYHLLPLKFLMTLVGATSSIPFPPAVEMLVVLLLFEILNEASVRMPRYLGVSLSIVGAIVLGDTAVKAGLISSPAVLVTALSSIGVFCVPDQVGTLSVLRIAFLLVSAVLGLFGMIVAFLCLTAYLACLSSFGSPYLAPYAPRISPDLKDGALPSPVSEMYTRPYTVSTKNRTRMRKKEDSRD